MAMVMPWWRDGGALCMTVGQSAMSGGDAYGNGMCGFMD